MNQEKLNYEQILSLADQIKKTSSNMEQILNEVNTLFNRIGSEDTWAGTAAASAKEQFNRLSAKFPEFYNATNMCYSHLVSVVENYKNVDTTISQQ